MAEAEAVEQNKAITDILRVIGSSPADLQPVFDTILSHAKRLCQGNAAVIWQYDGSSLHYAASHGGTDPAAAYFGKNPLPLGAYNPTPQAALERRTVHVTDVFSNPKYRPLVPRDSFGTLPNAGTVLAVPLLRQEELFGVISIWRFEKRLFTDKQIAMVEAFAAQAAIAIHNVRLHNETREALEQQTATAEILKVISASPNNTQPVFQAIAERAGRICQASDARIFVVEGSQLRHVAGFGDVPAPEIGAVRPIERGLVMGRAVLELTPVQVDDVQAVPEEFPTARAYGARFGHRTILAVPLVRDGRALGAILLRRLDVRPFSEKQVVLLTTFADQAAIAIENVRLFNETKEALEQQTATSQVLGVISSSPTDVAPVYRTILDNVTRLCEANIAALFLYDGEFLRTVAHHNATAAFTKHLDELRVRPSRETPTRRAALERQIVHVEDALSDPSFSPSEDHRREGARTVLSVPMLREGSLVGVITVWRRERRLFTYKQVALVKTFADQAVIAIENVRLFNETREALERQTATSDVLRVISASPTDVQPVLDSIAERAAILCHAKLGFVARFDGKLLHMAAFHGASAEALQTMRALYPMDPGTGGSVAARVIRSAAAVQVPDVLADPEYAHKAAATAAGFRSALGVPLLREGQIIGAIIVVRGQPALFPEKQIELLKTFADQAVIAIENVRLFNETKEALERQTATGEVLRVIAGTPADAQPVFDAIAQSALRLFGVSHVGVTLHDGETIRSKATAGSADPRGEFVIPLNRESTAGRAILDRTVANIGDTEAAEAPSFARESGRIVGFRAIAAAPMLRDGEALGSIHMMRKTPGPFSDAQIELLRTFADQAVIAIENVRLFNELQTRNRALTEALEQQTATGDILKVISRSTTDVQPVFETIIRNAVRLCDGTFGMLWQSDGKMMDVGADYNFSPQSQAEFRRAFPHPLGKDTPAGQAILEKRVVNLPDIHETAYSAAVKDRARTLGYRSVLVVPMMRDDEPIGALAVTRSSTGSFADSHVALLKTFADQAVIAIENVRLFNETKEALEQQTAISEVLRVISSSPADVQPVLDAVAVRAARICDAIDAHIFLVEGEGARHTAHFGDLPLGITKGQVRPLDRAWATGRAILDRVVVHIEDLAAAQEFPISQQIQARSGARTGLAVPLMRENRALGAIVLRRTEVRPFSDKQLALLKTFADQAAIAIENVRLFNETKESLDQQKASADVLGVISSSIADTKPVFDKILESCEQLFEGQYVGVAVIGEDGLAHLAAYHGPHPEALRKGFPIPVDSQSATGLAILERRVLHYPDVLADADVPEFLRRNCERTGIRSIIVAPMLWEMAGIGAIFVSRQVPGAFSEKAIRQLKTFADQAVIAIQNARLFREIQEKSAQLEVANKHKSDFLANMSHELRTPLNAIIGFSEALMERMFGELNDKQSDYLKDIHESGRHLLSLINDILDLSKIEAGRMDLEVSSFHLPTALSNAMTLIRERAQRHAIELGLDVDERLGEFEADERKFKQIMLNLLSNAVKFTPDGGRVDVCAKKDTDKIEIAVKDTGIGIAPEDQAAVFEEFKQVGRDQLRKAEGTGLGLALTRRFVELHGGAIRLESTPGKGSTFTVCLPIRN